MVGWTCNDYQHIHMQTKKKDDKFKIYFKKFQIYTRKCYILLKKNRFHFTIHVPTASMVQYD